MTMAGAGIDTIFAAATGAGRAAVTVLRLSGPAARGILHRLAGVCPAPRRASLRPLRGADGEVLDRALVLWLPGPSSYTGEDCAELHLHGGRAVLDAVSETLVQAGARPAEAGEFTRRAFLNGRMDLLEAEAVADLVDAETSAQRRQALRQLEGALGGLYRGWTQRLTRLLAQQEALIDFPDEDLPPGVEEGMRADMAALGGEIAAHLDDGRRGERLREGLVFAVTGAPNVGKSTLINALAGRDIAIVAATPGTTRDVLEVRAVFGGVPVTLLDTAGLRETADPVEAEGIRRARARAASADLVVLVCDGSCAVVERPRDAVVVGSKADLGARPTGADLLVSAVTGFGLDGLRDRLAAEARRLTSAAGPPALTRHRHRAALTECRARLHEAAAVGLAELRGEDLRMALHSLGRITGRVGVDAVLDEIFGQFCIGK
jgi:tRNA modification GTPase